MGPDEIGGDRDEVYGVKNDEGNASRPVVLQRGQVIDAYVQWLQSRDPDSEWAWEALHDAVWFEGPPVDLLEIVIEIANRVGEQTAALQSLGAGPLEDLLGGDKEVMERAVREAHSNPAFRIAAATVYGVRGREPGYEKLADAIEAAGPQ